MSEGALVLVVRRFIRASPQRLYDAWLSPTQLVAWWGPRGVRCTGAEVEPWVGGHYRIGNELPGGKLVQIAGEFLELEPPEKLVFTWAVELASSQALSEPERVTVRFQPSGAGTEVIVTHERI